MMGARALRVKCTVEVPSWLARDSLRLTILCLLGLALGGCSFSPPKTYFPPAERDLAAVHQPGELRADLDFLVATLRDTHCNLFHDIPEDEFAARAARLRDSLDRPMTREEFYWRVAPLAAAVRDGHTAVEYPGERFAAHVVAAGSLFPIDTRIRAGELRVVASHAGDEEIPPDSTILRIQGRDAAPLMEELLSAQSAEHPRYAEQRALLGLRQFLFERFGAPSVWTIDWRTPEGATRTGTFRALSREELYASRRHQQAAPSPAGNYSFRILEGERVGIIDFRSMNDAKAFRRFLDDTFATIAAEDLRALVVDLRANGGGSSDLGDMLIAQVSRKPYRFISRMDVRSSRQYRAYLKGHAPAIIRWLPIQNLDPYGRVLWGVPAGGIASIEVPLEEPAEARNRFGGPVFFLVGPRTYSSASMLAAAVKDCGLGTIVGEETGGLASHYGELYGFTLPNTRLHATSAVKCFLRPSGIDDGRGVLPDIEVPDVPGHDGDEALAKVLELLGGD